MSDQVITVRCRFFYRCARARVASALPPKTEKRARKPRIGRRARFDQIGKLINAGLLLAHRNAAGRHTVEKER